MKKQMNRERSTPIDDAIREQWLDKLWRQLFDTNSGGLMSPGQIRRERRDRRRVRQIEMKAILDAESEINEIHRGAKALDDFGNVISTPRVENISTHKMIENTQLEQDKDVGLESAAMMLRSAVKEVGVRDLERSLNLKKMAILAETEIMGSPITAVSSRPVHAEWMLRWRECAEEVFNAEMQLLWVRMLVREVAQPGRFTMALMSVLRQLGVNDLETIFIVGKYTFPDFIFNADESYFNTDTHKNLFEEMEDLTLLSLRNSDNLSIPSDSAEQYFKILVCKDKALRVTAQDPAKTLLLKVMRLSRVGRQLFELVDADTDLAYLFELARVVKTQGFEVVLGEWNAYSSGQGVFDAKMAF